MTTMSLTRAFLLCVATCSLSTMAVAQCAPSWITDGGFGADGDVHCALEWDPDGAGPARPELVVGGAFTRVAGVLVNNLARIDPLTLGVTPFGPGTNGPVRSLVVGASGELIIGGAFTQVGGVAAMGIASNFGGTWLPLGSGVDIASGGPVALLVQPSGVLIVGAQPRAGACHRC